nr:hypothetical protein [Tanacetum cinerariifolium]
MRMRESASWDLDTSTWGGRGEGVGIVWVRFAETHNMVAYLTKSDASEGFNQIIDFLNGSSIELQAIVDKKKVVVTEATIREALRLDNEEGVECLPNEEFFAELAKMGYEKPSTKLTFYKAFFSSQLVRNVDSPSKFYMYPRFLQLMIRKQVGDLLTYTTKYTSPALTQKVFANMRRVGNGFSGVETPLFEGMLLEQQVVKEGDAKVNDETINAGDAAERDDSATYGEVQLLLTNHPFHLLHHLLHQHNHHIIYLQLPRVKKLERRNKVRVLKLRRLQKVGTSQRVETSDETVMDDVSNQGRMVAKMDQDVDVVLKDDKEDDREVANAVKDAKDKGKEILVEEPKPLKKKQQIKQDEQYARELHALLNKNIDWDEVIDHVKIKAKEDPAVKKYQALKRKPQTEAQARKNMMLYLKNVAGFKMDYFKGMSYDYIRPIFEAKFNSNVAFLLKTKEQIEEDKNRALQRLNETPAERAAKRQKLNEELILLVERKYPRTRFTLDQMMNAVRLEVEEESEVSLELLRLEEKHAKCLMLLVKDLLLPSQVDVVD